MPAGTHLRVVSGTVTVTKPGTLLDSLDIKGALVIAADNVTVTRCLIEGAAGTDSVIVRSAHGTLLQDDEVGVAVPAPTVDAMSVANATLVRLNIHDGVDGIKLGANSVVKASWIHSLRHFASDPSQGGRPTHNDAIQILGGSHIRVLGNYLFGSRSDNSALQVTQDGALVSDLVVSGNWADGGGCTFNFSSHGPAGQTLSMNVTATSNRFGHNTLFASCPIVTDLSTTLVQSGNVYDDTGKPIAVQRHN